MHCFLLFDDEGGKEQLYNYPRIADMSMPLISCSCIDNPETVFSNKSILYDWDFLLKAKVKNGINAVLIVV